MSKYKLLTNAMELEQMTHDTEKCAGNYSINYAVTVHSINKCLHDFKHKYFNIRLVHLVYLVLVAL